LKLQFKKAVIVDCRSPTLPEKNAKQELGIGMVQDYIIYLQK
jgi:hypothetical protein